MYKMSKDQIYVCTLTKSRNLF